MSWEAYVLVVVLPVGLGYVGARIALARDGRERPGESAGSGEATFALEHLDGQTWALTNTGTAVAHVVSVVPLTDGVEHWPPEPAADAPVTVTSERLPTLAPGGSTSLWLSRHDRGQQVLVGWTSEANVRMGPVTLDVPAP